MKNSKDAWPKIMLLLSVISVVYVYGAASHKYSLFPYAQIKLGYRSTVNIFKEIGNISGTRPVGFLQPARKDGAGVTINELPVGQDDLLLLSGFFGKGNGLRLIKRNGDAVAVWDVRFSELFPDTSHLSKPPATDWNIDLHGALINSDGSVVFNFEYGGLVKLDRCGNTIWTLSHPTHHSVEPARSGGYWVPGRRFHGAQQDSSFPPFETPYSEDTVLLVSSGGEIEREISVPQLFYNSDLAALLTATGQFFEHGMAWDHELVHLNKIGELSDELAEDFPEFDAGDLLLSIRGLNLVMVVDPDNEIIKWWQIGPWLRQHDPEFKPGGKITVFNNNTFFPDLVDGYFSDLSIPRVSNIIELDPQSRAHRVLYGGVPEQELLSVIRGKHDLTVGGGLLITEFEGGRVLETDASGRVVWEYLNRYDAQHVAEINEAKLYSRDYFSVSDWSCE